MNKISLAFIFLGVSAFAGCGGERSSSASANKTSAPSSVSYASNTAVSTQSADREKLSQSEFADQTSKKSGGGGGGAGRNESTSVPFATKVSLEQTTDPAVDNAPTDRKIIRNAELNLEADSPEQAQQKITTIAESKGGFVVESQQSSSDTKITISDIVTMTVRVPSAKFLETLEDIRKTGSRVIVETVKGTDVTEEFIDIEARLKTQKALEQQFVEIMKRANSVDDALSVQRQLAEVRGEIEKVEGRKRFLENQASLSTIKVRLQTPAAFSASSSGFGYRLKESFSAGFDFALNFVLGLVTLLIGILPFAIFIGLPGFLIVRYFIRKQKKAKTVNEIVREEINKN